MTQITHSILFPALAATPRTEPGGPDMTRYLLVCALLLALVGAMAYLFKRFVAGAVRARAAKRSLQILDVLPLGGKQRVCVVRCYDRTFALGLGDKEVALIAELDPVVSAEGAGQRFGEQLEKAETQPGLLGMAAGLVNRPKTATNASTAPKKRSLFASGGIFG